MSSTRFFRFPWAASGDKTAIPDTVPPSGAVSYPQGFGPDYERDPATDPLAKRVPRDETNQLYHDITDNLRAWQVGALPEWVEASQNGGTAVTYPVGSLVRHDQSGAFVNYMALVETTGEPGVSLDWTTAPFDVTNSLRLNQSFPEVEATDNELTVTSSAGNIVLTGTSETWVWRGHRRFSVGDFLLADRTLAHTANKTYHLRWHAPGTGTATPEATYPNGRFELADMAGLTEADQEYDTTYDRMLIALVVTDGSNVATIAALANADRLIIEGETFLTNIAWAGDLVAPSAMTGGQSISWMFARTPRASTAMMTSISTVATSDTLGTQQINVGIVARNRYSGLVTYQKTQSPQSGYVSWSAEA